MLDLVLPGDDGLALARWLRTENSGVGIIMMTGRGETIDRIIGLEMGADDYLVKPFHLREVLARNQERPASHQAFGREPTRGRPLTIALCRLAA